MIHRIFGKHSAKALIALGQVSILVCLILVALLLGVLPNASDLKRQERLRIAETVAINSSMLITRADLRRLETTLQLLKERYSELITAGVRRGDERLMVTLGEHEQLWQPSTDAGSTDRFMAVPLYAGNQVWGHIEFVFEPLSGTGLMGFLQNRLVLFIAGLALVCFLVYYLYLGKMLKHLDPSQAIPGRVRSALDTMAEGLIVIDRKQNIVLANSAFAAIVDKAPDKLIGLSLRKLPWLDEHGAPNTGALPWEESLQQGRIDTNLVLRLALPDGTRKTFMVNCSPVLAAEGKVGGALISFDDVTLLEEKELELRRAKDEAEHANRAKSDFLATMSHEIRTPMNAILGFTELLRRGVGRDPEDYQKHLATIANSGTHLLNLINDVLDLSKVESGALEVEIIECNTLDSVRQVMQFMQVKAEEQHLYLRLEVSSAIPETLLADPGRLRQILTNLIGNALKFTEQGGVVVRLSADRERQKLQIAVCDTGIGMSEEQSAKVFDPFVQADSSITRRFGGTGLGLSISRKFALAMGGDIHVQSNAGQGSEFTVELPLTAHANVSWIEPASLGELTLEASAERAERHWQFRPAQVLVVDDGAENRELIQLVLKDEGLTITTATNGAEALEHTARSQFDIILMDVQMPVMDGYSAVARMRADGLTLPIVALTAHAMKGIEERCLQAGYSHYMTKPIDIDQLLDLMATLLDTEPTATIQIPEASVQIPTLASIQSRLASQERFKPLIERFIPRCREQVQQMSDAYAQRDFDQVKSLAHWLKGAGGSLGFDCFTEPALQLELAAGAHDEPDCTALLAEITSLAERLQAVPSNGSEPKTAPGVTDTHKEQAGDSAPLKPSNGGPASADPRLDAAPIVSSLAQRDARFAPLVERFIVSLDEKLTEMEQYRAAQAWQDLANSAHWMKGSGGSLGFELLAEAAAELETACQQAQLTDIEHALASIHDISHRIMRGVKQSA